MGSYRKTRRDMDVDMDVESQDVLLELIDQIHSTVRAGVTIKEWVQQKWVAAVDEYNECRYDCRSGRLEAA